AQEISGVTEAARGAVGALGEVLEEVERVADHPARLGGGGVLANARRALARAARRDRSFVDYDHVADAALREMKRGADTGPPAADDHHVCRASRRHRRDASMSSRPWTTSWR